MVTSFGMLFQLYSLLLSEHFSTFQNFEYVGGPSSHKSFRCLDRCRLATYSKLMGASFASLSALRCLDGCRLATYSRLMGTSFASLSALRCLDGCRLATYSKLMGASFASLSA